MSGILLPLPLGYSLILLSKLCGFGISFLSKNLNLEDSIFVGPDPLLDPLIPPFADPEIVYAETSILRISLPAS